MLVLQNDIVTPRLLLRLMEREVIDSCLAGDLQRAERLLDTKEIAKNNCYDQGGRGLMV
jgi:hypothetical protein